MAYATINLHSATMDGSAYWGRAVCDMHGHQPNDVKGTPLAVGNMFTIFPDTARSLYVGAARTGAPQTVLLHQYLGNKTAYVVSHEDAPGREHIIALLVIYYYDDVWCLATLVEADDDIE
jgi:hypothetical protein